MKNLLYLLLMPAICTSMAAGVQKPSDLFPYKYECTVLPSAAGYTYTNGGGLPELSYASIISGDILKMDSDTDGADNDSGYYSLDGGPSTVWNPGGAGPFTIEVKMRSLPNNAGSYNAWFDWNDGSSDILLQVWFNKVSLNGVEVTGLDNQTSSHVFRIVSVQYGASADQKFDLYRDGVLIINDAPNVQDYGGAGLRFGDMTGFAESNVEVDYIRWDDSNAWEPVTPGDSSGYPYRYEAAALPTAVTPAYTYSSGNGTLQSAYATLLSPDIIKLDTDTDGQDSDSAWYTLTGGAGTVWNPGAAGPFTIEVKMRSLPNNAGSFNAWFDWNDGNSDILLQVWHNKVSLNNVEVTGLDNQSNFHVFRLVSDQYGASADQRFDLYRDGVQIINDAINYADYSGSKFRFGDMTGFPESNIEVDYIRWDDKNAWRPPSCGVQGYLKGDFNRDCAVDMKDIAKFTESWLFSTNAGDGGYIDCSDPVNIGLCQY